MKLIYKKGFSLVEVLISIAILALAVAVPISVISKDVLNARDTENRVIAHFLLQEVIESIRQIRDTQFIKSKRGDGITSWHGITDNCVGTIQSAKKCFFNSPSGLSQAQVSQGEPFERYVLIKKLEEYELQVIGVVRWDGGIEGGCGNSKQCLQITENIYNFPNINTNINI